jgi:cytochrome c-type biogenesis protein CcmH/NrfG
MRLDLKVLTGLEDRRTLAEVFGIASSLLGEQQAEAELLLQAGQAERARDRLEVVVGLDARRSEAWILLARAYEECGEGADAAQALGVAARLARD